LLMAVLPETLFVGLAKFQDTGYPFFAPQQGA
jgi:hypothetical protein